MDEMLDYVAGGWGIWECVVWMLDWVWMLGSCCTGFSSIAEGEDPLILCVGVWAK